MPKTFDEWVAERQRAGGYPMRTLVQLDGWTGQDPNDPDPVMGSDLQGDTWTAGVTDEPMESQITVRVLIDPAADKDVVARVLRKIANTYESNEDLQFFLLNYDELLTQEPPAVRRSRFMVVPMDARDRAFDERIDKRIERDDEDLALDLDRAIEQEQLEAAARDEEHYDES